MRAWLVPAALRMTMGTKPDELCLVCQDISTGYHYGVPSCNGCKTFFRRTIMKKQTFVCQYDGKCPVDKSIRCACRHCRFEKCLQVGMDRSAIQQNRDPIGYTKRTRRYPLVKPSSTSTDENSPGRTINETTAEQLVEDQLLETLIEVERKCKKIRNSNIIVDKNLIESILSPCIILDSEFMDSIDGDYHSCTTLRPATQSDYQYWHERDWIIMVEWAKTIPIYESLPIGDKLALLRHSAITYPSLLQCFYSPDRGPDTIVFPNGAFFDRTIEPSRPLGFQKRKYQMLDQLLGPMRKLNIDISEFTAFKAIFFLNPDADDVSVSAKEGISDCRCAITNALYRYMVRHMGVEEAADRFGKLLLLGTVLATMAVEMKEAVVVADFFDQVQFPPLAKQLLFGIKNEEEHSK